MKLICYLVTVLVAIGCKIHRPVADKKFSTFVQAGIAYLPLNDTTNLTRKVHYQQWRICYAIDCPITMTKQQKNITTSYKKRHEELITKALKTWLQPIDELTNKKLIGSNPDNFYYRYFTNDINSMCKINKLKNKNISIGDGEDYTLKVVFLDTQDQQLRGKYTGGAIYTPCLSNDGAHTTLLHEIGHAFGLLDTYPGRDKVTYGLQPPSVMSCFFDNDKKYALTNDDIKGIQWQYRYYQSNNLKQGIAPVSLTTCPFPDYEYVQTNEGGACRPKHLFMHNLQQAHHFEKTHSNLHYAHKLLESLFLAVGVRKKSVANLDVNYQDKLGNTGLHYMVLFGAYSLWSNPQRQNSHLCDTVGCPPNYDIAPIWSQQLAESIGANKSCNPNIDTNCIDINKQNNNGDTAIHHAVRTGYVQAARLLLAHPKLDTKIKNKQNKTACDLAKQKVKGLQEANLCDIKIKKTKIAEKIHAISIARSKILNLLSMKNACF